MSEVADIHTLWTLLVGFVVIASGLIEAGFKRLRIPALVGYLLLGMLLSIIDDRWGILSPPTYHAFSFLADIGVIVLLFHVGLRSHPGALTRKLPKALKVWVGDVCGSALLGFLAAYYLLGLALIPSLIVATALTATSVGVSVVAWQDTRSLDSANGQLLVDVAELDDISAVALMALLFVIVPILHGEETGMFTTAASTGAGFIVRFALFLTLCYLFSRYLEPRVTGFTARLEPAPQRMLTVVGVGLVIAAFANWLGFSLAIGALFAGLVFSRDPQAIRTEKSFTDIYAFAMPFFFINIGLHISPEYLATGAGLGLLLLLAAVAGKFIGAGTPSLLMGGMTGGSLIGVSMIPRAEISMIVIQQAQQLGDWAMPEQVYAAMVFVSMATCIGAPLVLYRLLHRWPQKNETGAGT